jgi:RNA polymerase sigma-70 factor (ECF subfamily)
VTTEEVIESDETTARVRAGIFSLPVSYRVVLMLRDIEGYDTSETAKLLDISVENVKVRVHRARAALKKILEPVLRGEVI